MEQFERIEQVFSSGGADAVFGLLLSRARREPNPRLLFETTIMQTRHRLGLPLIQTDSLLDVADEHRPAYEAAFRDAAREAGRLCLESGDIVAAWPFYRAIGEPAPVAAAIEKFEDGENVERIIEIAFQEGVHPRKGFELILRHRGVCSAISWVESTRDYQSRQACLRLLVQALYRGLAASLAETIKATEGVPPASNRVGELISGRDWLFESNSSYTDSTHLASVLRYGPELEDEETLRMVLEMAEYGCRLASMFHFRGEPPFEDIYRDYAVYLRALVGDDPETAITHFREKADAGRSAIAAEVLVDLLVRQGRTAEAIGAFREYFPDPQAAPMNCPSLPQLCQIAGDFKMLREVSREGENVLAFAAGVIQAVK